MHKVSSADRYPIKNTNANLAYCIKSQQNEYASSSINRSKLDKCQKSREKSNEEIYSRKGKGKRKI